MGFSASPEPVDGSVSLTDSPAMSPVAVVGPELSMRHESFLTDSSAGPEFSVRPESFSNRPESFLMDPSAGPEPTRRGIVRFLLGGIVPP